MKLSAEISIDIDSNRKIWITGTAENVDPDQVAAVQAALQENVTAQGLAAYNMVSPQMPQAMTPEQVIQAARAASGSDPAERRPREDDPESMRTFGEEHDAH